MHYCNELQELPPGAIARLLGDVATLGGFSIRCAVIKNLVPVDAARPARYGLILCLGENAPLLRVKLLFSGKCENTLVLAGACPVFALCPLGRMGELVYRDDDR